MSFAIVVYSPSTKVSFFISSHTLGSTEQRFWSGFKIAFAVITLLSVLVIPILSVILDGFVAYAGSTAKNPSVRAILWFVSILIWGIALLVSSIYCFSKMLNTILTSSAKLAKMKRNEGAHLVHALRRRLFSHIGAAAFMGAITIISIFAGKLCELLILKVFLYTFISNFVIGFLLILINLLDTIRTGLLNIDMRPAESLVTELSSVGQITDSEIDRIERDRIANPTPEN
jgi:hypothetical protein